MLSATLICLNEAASIGDALRSLEWVEDVVVLDNGSTDATAQICAQFANVRYVREPWRGYAGQKNRAAELARHDWILNIDADERVEPDLRAQIEALDLESLPLDLLSVRRRNFFGDRWVRRCGWYPDRQWRLYHRARAGFGERAVHESVEGERRGVLEGHLRHYTYRDLSDYMQRMDRYSSLAARQMLDDGRRPRLVDLLLRPPATFARMLLLRRGFLEGRLGWTLAALYAQYTWYKYLKARELVRVSGE